MGGRRHQKLLVCIPDAPENCCLNCDLLVNKKIPDHPFSISQSERQGLWDRLGASDPKKMTEDILATYKCHMGVWEQGSIIVEIENKLSKMGRTTTEEPSNVWDCSQVIEDRGWDCFFYPYEHRRRLDTTVKLERRAANRREAKEDRKLTRNAFWIAFAALIAAIVATIANLLWNVWTHFYPLKS